MGEVVPPGLVRSTPSCSVVLVVVAAEVGTLGVSVETSCAVDADAAVFVVVLSDVAVSLVGGAGTVVESCVVEGTGAGA